MNTMEMAFGGLKVIESPHMKEKRPVIELSRCIDLSPEGRSKVNKSLLDMFGETSYVLMTKKHIFAQPHIVDQPMKAHYDKAQNQASNFLFNRPLHSQSI